MEKPAGSRGSERVSTSFKLSAELRTELKVAAAREGREMSELLSEALEVYLAKKHGGQRGTSK
jgi:predicted DNA-binding protein